MPEDDYYDSMETNPFRLSNDFDIYKARADDQREKAEQAALLKKVPIHLRTNEYASRNRNLGLTDPKSKGSVSSSRHSSTTTSNASGRGSRAQAGKSSTSLPPIAKARNQRVAREEELQIPKEVFNRLDAYSPLYSEKYAHLTKKDREFLENLVRDPGPRPKLDEYMGKQRDIFLAELSLQTKKSEINNINNQIRAKEDSLKAEVKKLDVEVSKFDKFIRHSDLGTVKTISESEKAVKARTQRQEMIRNTSSQIIALKSEITKYELSIRQLHRYRLFLDQLISVKDRELLVGRRERYTVQRMAIAFCLEKYGHCHGLCLTCFCFPLNPTIVQTGAITPYNLLVMDDTVSRAAKPTMIKSLRRVQRYSLALSTLTIE
ncbi:Amino acid transporter [Giardia duodenalis]|uniref:Amino acid transporter n=1 Tax=Giardia intestinalis TaxID=5741 RepID=V6TZV5_GIAIN|nr:Amino acid transporter [Giardia intestinalis]